MQADRVAEDRRQWWTSEASPPRGCQRSRGRWPATPSGCRAPSSSERRVTSYKRRIRPGSPITYEAIGIWSKRIKLNGKISTPIFESWNSTKNLSCIIFSQGISPSWLGPWIRRAGLLRATWWPGSWAAHRAGTPWTRPSRWRPTPARSSVTWGWGRISHIVYISKE